MTMLPSGAPGPAGGWPPHWTRVDIANHLRTEIARAQRSIDTLQAARSRIASSGRMTGAQLSQVTQRFDLWIEQHQAAGHELRQSLRQINAGRYGSGWSGGATRQAELPRPPRGRFPIGGLTVLTLAAVAALVGVGIWAITQQEDVLEEASRITDAPDPERVWVGPERRGECEDRVALEHGLIWTAQGWRAPQSLPEPLLGTRTEGEAYQQYLTEVIAWSGALEARVAGAVAEMDRECAEPSGPAGDWGLVLGVYDGFFTDPDVDDADTNVFHVELTASGISGFGWVEIDRGGDCDAAYLDFDHERSRSLLEELWVNTYENDPGRVWIRGTVPVWHWGEAGACPDLPSDPTDWTTFSEVDFELIVDLSGPEVRMDGTLDLGDHSVAWGASYLEAFVADRS